MGLRYWCYPVKRRPRGLSMLNTVLTVYFLSVLLPAEGEIPSRRSRSSDSEYSDAQERLASIAEEIRDR